MVMRNLREELGIIGRRISPIRKEVYARIPVGYKEDGSIILLPVDYPDQPVIGVTGIRGSGKTEMVQRLIDNVTTQYLNYNVLIINDVKGETAAWKYPQDKEEELEILEGIGLREKPMGLPIYTIAPAYSLIETTKTAQDMFSAKLNEIKSQNAWNSILSFEESAFSKFVFDSISIQLSECSTLEEMRTLINENKDINQMMRRAILLRIKTFLMHPKPYPLINNPEAKVNSLERIYRIIEKRRILSLNTYYAQSFEENYLYFYVALLLDAIFKRQSEANQYPKKYPAFAKPLWTVFLELTSLTNTQNQNHGAAKAINQVLWRGRQIRMGGIWEAQDYAKVPSTIRNQTNYLFCFKQGGSNNIKAIKNDLGIGLTAERTLQVLQKYEFLLLPKDNYISILRPDGTEEKYNKPVIAYALPCLSKHLQSGEMVE